MRRGRYRRFPFTRPASLVRLWRKFSSEMDVLEETTTLYFLLRILRRRRRRRNRRLWVDPILSNRLLKGQFVTLYGDLRENPNKFFQYFRMSIKSFDKLLALIRNDITGTKTNMRLPITPEEKMCITLRYLGTGCTLTDLHFSYRMGISTISEIVQQLCEAIWQRLKGTYMPLPSEEIWLNICEGFEKAAGFPNCIGAIDGKHIRIMKPSHSGSLFYNYKHFFSMVLLAVCDSNYCFIYVDVGSYGKSSDSGIFKNSVFYRQLLQNTLNIPGGKPLPNSDTSLPYVLVGDEGFGLSQALLRPYGGKNLTVKKKVFNYRLTRARRYIECAFGILSNKWRIFHRPLNVSVQLAEKVVKACCVLHNFVRVGDGFNFEDTLTIEGFHDMQNNPVQGGRSANDIRDRFSEYFLSPEGEIPWQYTKI